MQDAGALHHGNRRTIWIVGAVVLVLAPFLTSFIFRGQQVSGGVVINKVERLRDATGLASCLFTVNNSTSRKMLVQAQLERLTGGQWQIIPCSQPGPMYISALWELDSGDTRSFVLPMPPDQGEVLYRVRVDHWPHETALHPLMEKLRNAGYAMSKQQPPKPKKLVVSGGTMLDWAARQHVFTDYWISTPPPEDLQPVSTETNP